ncbi:MAG TPA: MmgE/PrpD family protein [Burkholderiales bacterium]|nr:MmgE/PrpD family protein [Burkholderiales bacterium]
MARLIARWVREVDATALDAPVVDKAKVCLLDLIGIAAQATDLPWSRQAVEFAAAMGGDQATLVGSPARASAAEAAFANATTAHGLVQEDMHTRSVSHIGVVVWPTLLALAEHQRSTGADLIAAAAAGYQVTGRLGHAVIDKDVARRFRPTGLFGATGAAAAGARLLRLSEDEMTSAIALAANTAGGFNEWAHTGGDEMFFHPGFAARNAVTSVLLARAGARASESALDGRAGFYAAYGREPGATLELDGDWEILAVYHKPAPACNFAQTPAQAAAAVRHANAIAPREIEQVVVRSFPEAIAYPGCDHAGPYGSSLQAKMSIQLAVAAVLVHGRLDEAFYRSYDRDETVASLARRVRLENDAEFAAGFPQRQGAEVIVSLQNGRSVRHRLAALAPLDAAGVRARTRAALSRLFDPARAQRVDHEIDKILGCPDAARIARLLARDD